MKKNTPQQLQHEPVLLANTLEILAPKQGETYLDLTAGYGGHAKAVIDRVGAASLATLVDRDAMAIASLQPLAQMGARILHTDFYSAAKQLQEEGQRFDMILADLGVSSPQFDIAERGFSIRESGPLDMRMDRREATDAATLINELSVDDLAQIIKRYGEEPQAKRIAQAIADARPITTTEQFKAVINTTIFKHKALDATVRTFQALRIAVNRELELIEQTLQIIPDLLKPGGRVAIISFHSLEDRLVKRFFQEETNAGYEARLKVVTKTPIAGNIHDVYNPRARSAKLRAAVK